jgi:hypothetical protein
MFLLLRKHEKNASEKRIDHYVFDTNRRHVILYYKTNTFIAKAIFVTLKNVENKDKNRIL